MGEAARRKADQARWFATLDIGERIVVNTARALYELFPLEGACYQASLFLEYYLVHEHGVDGRAVVGFVNDGTDDLYCPHAWYTFRCKITDVALWRPLRPEIQRPGPLIIHGRQFVPGWSKYTYHIERPPAGEAIIQELLTDPESREETTAGEQLHARMSQLPSKPTDIREYLGGAPAGLDYAIMSEAIRRYTQFPPP